MNCTLCSSNDTEFKFIYTGTDLYLKKIGVKFDLNWYSCNSCKVYFSKQYSDIESVYEDETLYDAAYNNKQILDRYNRIMSLPPEESDNISRVNRCISYFDHYLNIKNIKNNQYSILDIGSGLGVFPATMVKDIRFVVHALELNKVASSHIKDNIGITVYEDYMQNLNFHNKFDFISLNRVLEHVSTPIEVMKLVKKAIKDIGLIYLELPDSLSYKLDSNSNEAFSSGHYMVYNPSSIKYLFKVSDIILYDIQRVKDPSGKYTIYAFGGKK